MESLRGKLLVSSPSLLDPNFRKTVVLIAHHDDDVAQAAAPILDGLGFMPAEAEPDDLTIRRLRLFAGYSGWGGGQLEAELEESSWIVVDADADDAFADDPDELWRTVLHRKGRAFELM